MFTCLRTLIQYLRVTLKEASMDYSKAGKEPPINEMMEDPIMKLLMKSDGVSLGALLPLIEGVSDKVGLRKQPNAA